MVGHTAQDLDDGRQEADVVDGLGELDVAEIAGRVGDAAPVGAALDRPVDRPQPRVGQAAQLGATSLVGLAGVDLGDRVAALGGCGKGREEEGERKEESR